MKLIYYDVYTKDGTKIMSRKTSREISNELGITISSVSRCVDHDKYYKSAYRFVKLDSNEEAKKNDIPEEMWEEWNKVRTMFKNVIWVTKYEFGVIRLGMKKIG